MIKAFTYLIQSILIYILFIIGKLLGINLSRKLFSKIFLKFASKFRSKVIIEKNLEIFSKDLDVNYLLDVINKCWTKALKCNSDNQFENYKELIDHRNVVEADSKKLKEFEEKCKNLPDPLSQCEPEDFEDANSQEPYYLDEIMDSHNHLKDGRTSEDCDLDSDDYWNQEGAFEEATDKDDNFY